MLGHPPSPLLPTKPSETGRCPSAPATLPIPYSSCKRLFAPAQSKPDFISQLQFPWLWAMVDASHAELVKPIWGPVHRAGCVCCHMTSCLRPAGAQGHPLPAASLPAQAMCVLPMAGQMDVWGAGSRRTGHSTVPAGEGWFQIHCTAGQSPLASVYPLGSGESGSCASNEGAVLQRHKVRPPNCCSARKTNFLPLGRGCSFLFQDRAGLFLSVHETEIFGKEKQHPQLQQLT